MSARHAAHLPVVVLHVDDRPVRVVWQRHARQLPQDPLVVERRPEQRARLEEQPLPVLRPAALRDLLEDADDPDDAAVGIENR